CEIGPAYGDTRVMQDAARLPSSRMPIIISAALLNRFNSRIDKSGDCWLWTGALRCRSTGYGAIKLHGLVIDTHVLAWRIAHGGIAVPKGQCVMHACDVRRC